MSHQQINYWGGLLAAVVAALVTDYAKADGAGCGCPPTKCGKARRCAHLDGRVRFGYFAASWQKWEDRPTVAEAAPAAALPSEVIPPAAAPAEAPAAGRAPAKLPAKKPDAPAN